GPRPSSSGTETDVESERTDAKTITVLQLSFTLNTPAVDQGAVGAAQVADEKPSLARQKGTVSSANDAAIGTQLAVWMPADEELGRATRHTLAPARLVVSDDKTVKHRGLPLGRVIPDVSRKNIARGEGKKGEPQLKTFSFA